MSCLFNSFDPYFKQPFGAVRAGQTLAVLYASDPARMRAGLETARDIFEIGDQPPAPAPLILGVVDAANVEG